MVKKETRKSDGSAIMSLKNNIWESHFLHLSIFIILSFVLFPDTIKGIVREWNGKPDASHGWLIPFILFFLIWRKRDEIKQLLDDKKSVSILFFSIASLILYYIGKISLVLTFERLGFIIFLISSAIFIIGKTAARKITFPIVYSLFMIPIPVTLYDYLTFPFKKLAAIISAKLISLLSIPVYREGNVIFLPNATLEISSACSGLNTLISVLALGTVWSYIMFEENKKRTVFILLLLPIAIVANVFRITFTGLIANFYSADITKGLLHEFSGTIFVIVIAFAMMILITKLIKLK